MEIYHILILLGIIAFIGEIFTAGFISGAIGVGFFFAAISNYLGLETKWQILSFSIGLILTFFLVRPILNKIGFSKDTPQTNSDGLIGKIGIVKEQIDGNATMGIVSIDGDHWQAKSIDDTLIEIGHKVEVVNISSIILFVKPL